MRFTWLVREELNVKYLYVRMTGYKHAQSIMLTTGVCTSWSGYLEWITWRLLLKHGKGNGTKNGKICKICEIYITCKLDVRLLVFVGWLTTTPGSINHGDYRSVERGVTKTRNGNWNGIKRKTMQYDIHIYMCNTYTCTCIYKYTLFVRITPLSLWRRYCTIYIHHKFR